MTADRWERISRVYGEAVACEPRARAAFLDAACAEDSALRADVESLLQHDLPSVAALDVMAAEIATAPPSTLIGTRLGPYRIQSLIGQGGMGQVFRAYDGELGREVAVKVLPPTFALDPNRRARFDREARILASLNHPHIAAIYGIAECDGLRGLVLELVEGETLADRLRARTVGAGHANGLPVKDALQTARQIAEALEAAHEKGIIHRDLKPANIKVTPDGTVKVLDFGLAKATSDHDDALDGSLSVGTPVRDTRAGVILGTVAYMSPEQAQGRRIDKRTDIWAFGCVLYEMLTGSPTFVGDTAADTIAAILERQPDWSTVPRTAPPRAVALLHRCLEKDPKRRLRDIGEALIALEDALTDPSQPIPTPISSRRERHASALWMTVAPVLAVITGAMVWALKPSALPASSEVVRLAVPVTSDQRPAVMRGVALSADGRYLAYVSDTALRVSVRAIDRSTTNILYGTEGAIHPFFSPDGKWIGFFAGEKLKKVPTAGGAVINVLDAMAGANGVWGSDDNIFFTHDSEIWKVAASGGKSDPVTVVERAKGEISHQRPLLLPDGKTLLYTIWYGPGWDEREIVGQRVGAAEKHVLVRGAGTARYAPTGHLIYTRAGSIMAVRFDASKLEVSGAPETLVEDLREGTFNADYDVSPNGMLAYVQQSREAYNRLPVIVDRKGIPRPLPGVTPAYYQNPAFSPDGRRLALMTTGSMIDIWIYDFARASLTRLTTEGSSQYPVWTSDGKRVVYRATRSGTRNLFWKSVDGTGAEERLTTSENVQTPWSSSPDGAAIAFDQATPETGSDIWVLPLVGQSSPRAVMREAFGELRPRFSPAGPWLAYVSNRSGRSEVYVQRYPGSGERWQISTDGGYDPTWSRDGRELFYLGSRSMKVMSVKIRGGSRFEASSPSFLFEGNYVAGEPTIDFDVHPDGRRFVMIQPGRPDPPVTHIDVVLNWFEELKRRLPAAR